MQTQTTQQVQPQFTIEAGHLVMYCPESSGLSQAVDATVNDKDRMNDLLAQEKYLASGYTIAMLEASHDQLFQVLKQNQETCYQLQRNVFQTMFQKGWYRLPLADGQSVLNTLHQFEQRKAEFPLTGAQGGQRAATASSTSGAGQYQSTGQSSASAQPDNISHKLNQKVDQAIQQMSERNTSVGQSAR